MKNQVVMKFKDQAKHKTLFFFFLYFEKKLKIQSKRQINQNLITQNNNNIIIIIFIYEIDAWQENRDCKRHSSIPLKTNPNQTKFILVGQNTIEHHTVGIPGQFPH